jgi:signal transduction histidine kinase
VTHDEWVVVVMAGGWSAAVGLLGLLVATLLRRHSLRWQLAVVALVAVGGFTAGLVSVAHAMFLSDHDLHVVLLVTPVAGLVSLALALVVAERAVRGSRAVEESARRLAVDGLPLSGESSSGPAEIIRIRDELRRTSARLTAAREQAAAVEASRRELVAWVSHDLRTPLAGLRAMSEALEDGLVDDPARYHRRIGTEVDRLTRMVDDLWELSRIHAGALQMTVEQVRVRDLVSDVLAGLDPVARRRGVRIGGDVDVDAVVDGDSRELGRVVSNLVVNAIRHTPDEGEVVVEGAAHADRVVVSVRDECGGIPSADLPRVFDEAWRGTASRTPDVERDGAAGAGLGLAIVKGIVAAHEGTVSVTNEGAGCRFVVTLPRWAGPSRPAADG